METNPPLLSICVPTYNRSKFLRVMLQALLPQVAEFKGQVEVWIIDNASPDNTQEVLRESEILGPFHCIRNDENIGPLRNVLKGPCELATGKYVWVLGDHNLLMPGALSHVLFAIAGHADLDVFLVNYRCALYPDNWPATAIGGHDGAFHFYGNQSLDDKSVNEWHQLVSAQNALCTSIYAHIVRSPIWKEYWRNRRSPRPYTDGISTYPHTWMLIERVFDRPAYYIGCPAITIYLKAQSWGDPLTQARVYLMGLPHLVRQYRRAGMNALRIDELLRGFSTPETRRVLSDVFRQKGLTRFIPMLTIACLRHPYLFPTLIQALIDSKCNATAHRCTSAEKRFQIGTPGGFIIVALLGGIAISITQRSRNDFTVNED